MDGDWLNTEEASKLRLTEAEAVANFPDGLGAHTWSIPSAYSNVKASAQENAALRHHAAHVMSQRDVERHQGTSSDTPGPAAARAGRACAYLSS
jgi:hypothetical protein